MDIIVKCVELLEITRPFKIELISKPNKRESACYWGMYSSKQRKLSHYLRVHLGNLAEDSRCLNTLIAHEFIHAWQEERGLKEVHGPEFVRKARELSKKLGLPNIYMPGSDI